MGLAPLTIRSMFNHRLTDVGIQAELAGDAGLLLDRLGTPDGLAVLAQARAPLPWAQIQEPATLQTFLHQYRAQLLVACEWPGLLQAYHHARRQETRELIALDNRFTMAPGWEAFATASQRLGQMHLRRLRPLRDQRLVRRYGEAVAQRKAHGWHTLVYGVVLAIYQLPLRQGLISYARQTMHGLLQSAAAPLQLPERDSAAMLELVCEGLPEAMEKVLGSAQK
jgi:urease accessory protein UreF